MKVEVGRRALLVALKVAEGVTPKRPTVPILSHVLLRVESGRGLKVVATDLEVSVQLHCATDGPATVGAVAVPARKILEVVREMRDDVPVLLEGTDKTLTVSSGRAQCRLLALPVDDYPAMAEKVETPIALSVGSDLAALLGRVRYAVSDESQTILRGALCVVGGESLRWVATDGHRLATATLPVKTDGTISGIVPAKALDAALDVLGPEGPVHIGLTDKFFALSRPGVLLAGLLFEGTFPNYEQVIPRKNRATATVERELLLSAVRRVSVVAEDRTRPIKLALQSAELTLSSASPDYGEAEEHVPVDYDGEALEVGLNARYLMETLQAEPGGRIELSFAIGEQAASRPVLLQSPDAAEVTGLAVIMPMRI